MQSKTLYRSRNFLGRRCPQKFESFFVFEDIDLKLGTLLINIVRNDYFLKIHIF